MRKRKTIGEIEHYITRAVAGSAAEYAVFSNGAERRVGWFGRRLGGPDYEGPRPEATIQLPCGTFEFYPTPWGRMAILEGARQNQLREKSNNQRRREGLPMLKRQKRRRR